jgi:hypothetical protein
MEIKGRQIEMKREKLKENGMDEKVEWVVKKIRLRGRKVVKKMGKITGKESIRREENTK